MSAWLPEDLRLLNSMRSRFLTGTAGAFDYWNSPKTLELYDATFARRIGWKWDAVLGELALRGWRPKTKRLVDLACGTGIATRRVLEHWKDYFSEVTLVDRSPLARQDASLRVSSTFPACSVRQDSNWEKHVEGAVVLLSHVLTEISDTVVGEWVAGLKKAEAVIWVESATHETSRRLGTLVRDRLIGMGGWRVVAPCTHSKECPMRGEKRESDWCHHFAQVPSEVHQDAAVQEWGRELGVDLRVLPYQFLVLENTGNQEVKKLEEGSRVIGRARMLKGHHRVLMCSAEGVEEKVVQKRDVPELYRDLKREEGVPLYRLDCEGARVRQASRLFEEK